MSQTKWNPTLSDKSSDELVLGIDIGTSGLRAVIANPSDDAASLPALLATVSVAMPLPVKHLATSEQNPELWIQALHQLFEGLAKTGYLPAVTRMALDATSSTVLIGNRQHQALTPALMYDDKRAIQEAERIRNLAPKDTAAHGASSTLAKVMWLEKHGLKKHQWHEAVIFHQLDWVNAYLTGRCGVTDQNNALKLGYDPIHQAWPNWVKELTALPLPDVVLPGTPIGHLLPNFIELYGFNPELTVYSGTTDSIAAFLASGANQVGDAVTSLGSTLAIKLLSKEPIFAPDYGIYSHRLWNQWLVGGASNAGGAVLLKHFALDRLKALIPQVQIDQPTGLDYYPLASQGERFPISDPNLKPRIEPRPNSDEKFLKGLLEGLVNIEALGYARLHELGGPEEKRIFTTGGGIQNDAWMTLRKQRFDGKIIPMKNADAALGVTRLLQADDREPHGD